VEPVLILGKYILLGIGSLIGAGVLALVGWNFSKTLDTYSKNETDLRIQQAVDTHTRQTERLISTMDKLADSVEKLNIQMAVVEVKLEKD